MPSVRGTAWIVRICNYTDEDENLFINAKLRGKVCGRETCPTTGTPHLQGCIAYDDQKTLTWVKKNFHAKAHLEVMHGTWEENVAYCTKDGDIVCNEGTGPRPGERTDYAKLAERAKDLSIPEVQVWDEMPATMTKAFKAFDRRRDIAFRALKRPKPYEMPRVWWLWGPTGVGKSHIIFNDIDEDELYVHTNSDKWFDLYQGQKHVCFNEFRGQIPYSQLLELTDKWPTKVSRRGREPMPWVATDIIISSPMPPNKVYCRQDEKTDSIEQLLRRIEVVEVKEGHNITRASLRAMYD